VTAIHLNAGTLNTSGPIHWPGFLFLSGCAFFRQPSDIISVVNYESSPLISSQGRRIFLIPKVSFLFDLIQCFFSLIYRIFYAQTMTLVCSGICFWVVGYGICWNCWFLLFFLVLLGVGSGTVWIATTFLLVGLLLWLAGGLSYMHVLTSSTIPNKGNKHFDATSLVIQLQMWCDFVMAIVFLNSPQCEEKGKSSLSWPDRPWDLLRLICMLC